MNEIRQSLTCIIKPVEFDGFKLVKRSKEY